VLSRALHQIKHLAREKRVIPVRVHVDDVTASAEVAMQCPVLGDCKTLCLLMRTSPIDALDIEYSDMGIGSVAPG
jgi:hypothetical protein